MISYFRNLTFRSRILLLTALLCLFTAAASWVGYSRLIAAGEDLDIMYDRRLLPVQWMNDARTHINAIRGNMLQLMQTKDDSENRALLEDIKRRQKLNDENLGNFAKAELDEYEKKRMAEINSHRDDYRRATAEVLGLAEQNRNEEAYSLYLEKVENPLKGFNDGLVDLASYCVKAAAEANDESERDIAAAKRALLIVAAVAVILGAILGLLIERSINRPLGAVMGVLRKIAALDVTFDASKSWLLNYKKNEIAEMVACTRDIEKAMSGFIMSVVGASNRLGETSEEFSALAEESNAGVEESRAGVDDVSSQMESLAAATQEITASVEEVASGAQSTAQRSTDMAGEVEHARAAGDEGVKAIGRAVASIKKVASDAEESAKEVRELGDRAREIQSFVAQIGGIADQTNLLALNAAIEAARAGEAGRGFAVVAEEVRKLAEESNEAAKKIADLASIITKDLDKVVASSQNNAKDSLESSGLAEETRETIDRMMEALSKIASATQDMAAVSEEQAASSEEIASAVQNIASRVNASATSAEHVKGQMAEVGTSAERVAQGSEELSGLAADLRKLVSAFKYDEVESSGQTGLVPLNDGRGSTGKSGGKPKKAVPVKAGR